MANDLKTFDLAAIQLFYPAVDEAQLANVELRLPANRRKLRRQRQRLAKILNRTKSAAATIEKLPEPDQSLHMVLDGSFALADLIGATLQLSGQPLDELVIVTLGFSKKNVVNLGQLIDAGQVRRLDVLCSHYFAAQDAPIYNQMAELCQRHGFRLCAMRNHAKLLLMKTAGHSLVVESSANLRSCFNTETATMFSDPELYAFHLAWVDALLTEGAKA